MNAIKEEIKRLSKCQREIKTNRKTINFKGKRIYEPYEAVYNVWRNKKRLRHLFIAYAILKGKEPIYPTKVEYSKSLVKDLVEQYSQSTAA